MSRFVAVVAIGLIGLRGVRASGGDELRRLNYMVPVAAESEEQRPMLGDYVFADGSGMPVHLSRYRGQVVVLNFWATWCGPCIKQMTFLDRLQMNFKNLPLIVIGISEDQGGLPTSVIVDRHGRLFLRVEGPYQWDSTLIEAQLKKLVLEP